MKNNRSIPVVIPPYLFCGAKNVSTFMKTVITALNDFNELAYKKARAFPVIDSKTTSVTLNEAGVRSLDAYKEKHGLSSRNQAVMAMLATHHAKQPVIVERNPMPSFREAFLMVGVSG